VADIHPTTYELRLGILQAKAELAMAANPGLMIEPKVLAFLAHRIVSNVRVLEGALTRLVAFATLVGRPITLDTANECLADLIRQHDRKVTIEEIMRKVAEHYCLRMSDMTSARRARARGAAAAGGDVSLQGDDLEIAARDRPALRRARPHHGHARRAQDREPRRNRRADREDIEILRRMLEA
jgi:chromosomal replication initiator protein